VSAGQPLLVFNPFAEWDAALPLASLRYRFILESATRAETVHADVRPRPFRQRTPLILPLAGRVFVFDAHDGSRTTGGSTPRSRRSRSSGSRAIRGATPTT
jgi:hypothetical protein